MKRMSFVFVLIVAISLLGLTSCGRFEARMLVRKGNDLYNSKKYLEAINMYKKALEKAPHLYTIHLNIALSYMALYVPGSTHPKDLEYSQKAIDEFKTYLKSEKDPEIKEKVNGYLVNMYLNSDRKEDAIAYFEDHLKQQPNDTATIQKLAFLYAQTGKFNEALQWYQRRAALEPNNSEAYYLIGVICWEKSYKDPSITPEERGKLITIGMQALEKAMQINPKYADAYLYMNLLYREKAKLISPDPNVVPIPEDRIDEYNALLEKAKELQQKAVELRKQNPA